MQKIFKLFQASAQTKRHNDLLAFEGNMHWEGYLEEMREDRI
jgi:hypothetical protein